ncbi:MAG: hypothetical protein ABEJ75_01770, partial [Candidatus Nanohaloarchaea archaeon]
GWMLLVVAIVGGAIFATVQGQCQSTTSGFSGTDVRVVDFGATTNGNLKIQLRNGAASPIEVTNVSIARSEVGTFVDSTNVVEMGVGADNSVTLTPSNGQFTNVDGCNTFDLDITYNITGGLTNQHIAGTLTSSIAVQ